MKCACKLASLLLFAVTLSAAVPAVAQDYPTRPITMIVPYPPGGATDTIARIIQDSMSQKLGQQIIIENIGGAGGMIAAGRAVHAAPDGYTIMLHQVALAAGPAMYPKLAFDVEKDFVTIGLVNTAGTALAARGDLPPNNINELIRWLKEPGRNTKMAHAGVGSFGHLAGVLVAEELGVTVTQVPYRGAGPALNDLLAGQVDISSQSTVVAGPLVKAGKLKAYAIIGRNRPAHYWSMVAAQMCGAVPVPLYQDAVASEMAYVLGHSGARFVICGDQEQVDKVIEAEESQHTVDRIIYTDKRGMRKYDHSRMNWLRDVQAEGRVAHQRFEAELDARIAELDYDSTCVMLYTSGTTGKPKGVVLSSRNVIETARNSSAFDRLKASEDILAYLPMAWVGDFIFSVGQASWCGFCVNCREGSHTMMTDLREIGPTYFFAPPRVFEGQRAENIGDAGVVVTSQRVAEGSDLLAAHLGVVEALGAAEVEGFGHAVVVVAAVGAGVDVGGEVDGRSHPGDVDAAVDEALRDLCVDEATLGVGYRVVVEADDSAS